MTTPTWARREESSMPDHDDETSEVEKLAGGINATIDSVDETLGCLLRACWWSGLGCLGIGIVGTIIGGAFNYLEQRLGFWPTCVVFGLATWLAVHLCRRAKGGGGGR